MSSTQESQLTTDIEDLRLLKHHLPKSTQDFVMSVLDYYNRKGYVSEKQAVYVRKYATECRAKEAAKDSEKSGEFEEVFDGAKLRSFFDAAARNLKFPKLTILDDRIPGKKLSLHLATSRSRTPGWIIYSNGKRPPEYVIYATVNLSGEGEIKRNLPSELKTLIRRIAAAPGEMAGENGRTTGVCCFCGLTLTHATSKHHGYGPICAAKNNLPWIGPTEDAAAAEVELYPLDGLDKVGMEDL